MKSNYIAVLNKLDSMLTRKFDLLRGKLVYWRGGQVGRNFGVGRLTRILYPYRFVAGDDVTISELSYIYCQTAGGVKIGSNCSIDRNLWLHCGETGFFSMGDFSYIGCNAVIGAGGGGVKIGNNVLIGQTVNMHSENHVFKDPSVLIREQGATYQGITIEDDVWIGSKATILDGVVIGRGAVVGAGAVVTNSIPPYSIAVGIPAKVVGYRDKVLAPDVVQDPSNERNTWGNNASPTAVV
jgi:acetyltransferase-like isoleucine patch superfamily enzyme